MGWQQRKHVPWRRSVGQTRLAGIKTANGKALNAGRTGMAERAGTNTGGTLVPANRAQGQMHASCGRGRPDGGAIRAARWGWRESSAVCGAIARRSPKPAGSYTRARAHFASQSKAGSGAIRAACTRAELESVTYA